jgi:hypothetical protein
MATTTATTTTTGSAPVSPAWAPVVRALRDGAPVPSIVVTDPAEADAVAVALRRACSRSPWLLSLAAADAHRLLKAAGITLIGPALRRFDQRRVTERWGERPSEFEPVATTPVRRFRVGSAQPATAPAGLVASSLGYLTRPDASPWSIGSAVGRIEALTATVLTTLSPSGLSSSGMSPASSAGGVGGAATPVIAPTEAGYSHSAAIDYMGVTGNWDAVIQLHESFLKRQYDVLFASQVLAGIFVGGGEDVVDFRLHLRVVAVPLHPLRPRHRRDRRTGRDHARRREPG